MTALVIRLFSIACDSGREHPLYGPDEVTGQFEQTATEEASTLAEAKALLRKRGWVFRRDGTVICPSCTKPRSVGEQQ